MMVHSQPIVAQFEVGLTIFLHHDCSSQASLMTVKAVFESYSNAILMDYVEGLYLYVACQNALPADVVAYLAHVLPTAKSQSRDEHSPLFLAIQNHHIWRHQVPILSSPKPSIFLLPYKWNGQEVVPSFLIVFQLFQSY
jgi:hypothetical protein